MNRKLIPVAWALALLLALAGASAASAGRSSGPGGGKRTAINVSQLETDTMNEINNRRVALGLAPLRINAQLQTAARLHSADMGSHMVCGHTGTDGSSLWDRATAAGYVGTAWSEVIACNFSNSSTVVVNAWWNSPDHYGTLTMTNINDIGCGWYVIDRDHGVATCDVGVGP